MEYDESMILNYEYEQVLLGNKTSVTNYYFKFGESSPQHYALGIIKFAVENYLRWDPITFRDYFTKEVSEKLKLEPFMKYIEFPPELNKSQDYYYLAHLIYPNKVEFSEEALILRTYKDILEGKLKKFPKEYLSGSRGMLRAGICLQYMLNTYFAFPSTQAIYEHFASPDGMKDLKKYRLAPISSEMFNYPIDYVHESLPQDQRDEFWYHYYKFKMLNQLSKNLAKKE